MAPRSRRQFLALVGAGISGLGIPPAPRGAGRLAAGASATPDFPHPRFVDPALDDRTFERSPTSVEGRTTLRVAGPVVHRVWDPRADETVDATEHSPTGGEVTVETDWGAQDDVVDMLYRRRTDGELEYLFDLGAPPAMKDRVHTQANERTGDRYLRSFDDYGVTVSARLESADTHVVTVEVPYSLYERDRRSNLGGRTPVVPTPDDNDFDAEVHRPLLEALADAMAYATDGEDDEVADYMRTAVLAEFVQSIPHATDWQSKRQLHYVRTPAEALAELNADCKDASLLLYHLLQEFGYDPALVFLIGDVASVALEEAGVAIGRAVFGGGDGAGGNEKSEVDERLLEYPHHLAVVVPRQQLTPVPSELEELTTFEHDGEAYVYIESTNRRPPGVYRDSLPRLASVVYRSRGEFLDEVVPLL